MTFRRHAFISYAHIDNQPLLKERDGWVTMFHQALGQLLSPKLGCEANIWRDPQLDGNHIFSDEILDQFPSTAVMVSVLSPRYVKSEWCEKEIAGFCDAAANTGGVVVGNKSRIFKVIKTPLDEDEEIPEALRAMLGYAFYETDQDKNTRELDPAFGDDARQEFLRKVNKLAWDMKKLLDDLMPGEDEVVPADGASVKPAVYLAECARDRRVARELIEQELQRLGYEVLPARPLPTDETELVAEVEKLLAECSLSVHLVGTGYGAVPDGAGEKSVVVLQNELAVRASRNGTLKRVVSLPAGTLSTHVAQQAFIEAMHTNPNVQFAADLIIGSIEDVKSAILGALKSIETAQKPEAKDASPKRVFVICAAPDRKATAPLLKALKERGIDVRVPLFTGDPAQVRAANEELLANCDAVIVFYATADEVWKFQQQNELQRARTSRAGKAPLQAFTYLAEPMTDDKDLLLNSGEPCLIDGTAGFNPDALTPLLKALGLP
ncbi:MAG TPA: hypothetical protein VGF69_02510 [Thermoanaerobaculia bacterium]|jgi:hypothetical protein